MLARLLPLTLSTQRVSEPPPTNLTSTPFISMVTSSDGQRVDVLGAGDEVVGSAAQHATVQRPEAGASGRQLHGE